MSHTAFRQSLAWVRILHQDKRGSWQGSVAWTGHLQHIKSCMSREGLSAFLMNVSRAGVVLAELRGEETADIASIMLITLTQDGQCALPVTSFSLCDRRSQHKSAQSMRCSQ
jgi:hypothetical protein